MEPDAVNTLAREAEELRRSVTASLSDGLPEPIQPTFAGSSTLFDELVIAQWRESHRFEELVEYLLYMYSESGGDELWKQVLLDLRLGGETALANKLLDGLFEGRLPAFKGAVRQLKRFPDNYMCSLGVEKARGCLADILYEHAYLAENVPRDAKDLELITRIKNRLAGILETR